MSLCPSAASAPTTIETAPTSSSSCSIADVEAEDIEDAGG